MLALLGSGGGVRSSVSSKSSPLQGMRPRTEGGREQSDEGCQRSG